MPDQLLEADMQCVVIYESMYGNTHLIANAVADGLRDYAEVTVVPVADADAALIDAADVVVVGGPTHAHGMSRSSTRQAAVTAAEKPGADLAMDPDAEGPGLRDWFDTLGRFDKPVAAFDTRIDLPAGFTGRASKGIARRLRHHGAALLVDPESFFVTKDNHLEPHEEARAREWGAQVGTALSAVTSR
jgi:menaquinone-dependent protoporphyrinogen IX oxidase